MAASALAALAPDLKAKFERYSVPGPEGGRLLNFSGLKFLLKSCTGMPEQSLEEQQAAFAAGLGGDFDAKGRLSFDAFTTALRAVAARTSGGDVTDAIFVRFLVNHVVPHRLEDPTFAALARASPLEALAAEPTDGSAGLGSPGGLTSSRRPVLSAGSSGASTPTPLGGLGGMSPLVRANSVRASIRLSGDLAAAGVSAAAVASPGNSVPASAAGGSGAASAGDTPAGASTPARAEAAPGAAAAAALEAARSQAAGVLASLAAAPPPAPSPPPVAVDRSLAIFLDGLRLGAFTVPLLDLGAECVDDLKEVTDADLAAIGMKPLQQRRLREALAGKSSESAAAAAAPAPPPPAPSPRPVSAALGSPTGRAPALPVLHEASGAETATDTEVEEPSAPSTAGGKGKTAATPPTPAPAPATAPAEAAAAPAAAPAAPPAPESVTINGETVSLSSVSPAGAIGSTYYEWEEFATADGFLYYHNPRAGVTQWLRPASKSIRTLAVRAAEQAALAGLVERRVAAAIEKGKARREAEAAASIAAALGTPAEGVASASPRKGSAVSGPRPDEEEEDEDEEGRWAGDWADAAEDGEGGAGFGYPSGAPAAYSGATGSPVRLPPPGAMRSPGSIASPTAGLSLAPHPRGYLTTQARAHTGTSAYLSTADHPARAARSGSVAGSTMSGRRSLGPRSVSSFALGGSAGSVAGGAASTSPNAVSASAKGILRRASSVASRSRGGSNADMPDVEAVASAALSMIKELEAASSRPGSVAMGSRSRAGSVARSVSGNTALTGSPGSGIESLPSTALLEARRGGSVVAGSARTHSVAGGGGGGGLGGSGRAGSTSAGTLAGMYQDVFDAMPVMDERTQAVLARSYGVANPRRMGYADPRPDIRPRGVEAGTVLAPAPVGEGGYLTAPDYPGNAAHGLSMSLPVTGSGRAAKADAVWMSQLRAHLYSAKADPKTPRTGVEVKRMWGSGGLAPSEAAVGYAYRHAAATSMWVGAGDVYDRLCDPRGFTGMHRHRFDHEGRGLGMQGRDLSVDYNWLVNSVDGGGKGAAPVLPGAPVQDLKAHSLGAGKK